MLLMIERAVPLPCGSMRRILNGHWKAGLSRLDREIEALEPSNGGPL